jgi:RNA polymerase sigma-70 factor (ECF subfamily)
VADSSADTERIWEELHASLRGFVSRRVTGPADVDDVLQQVFVQIHRGLPSVRDDERVHAWIYRTARNVIADHYRRPARRREVSSGSFAELSEAADAGPLREPGDDEPTALSELAGCLRPLLETLPPADLEAIRLAELGGLTQAEAARQAGVSTSGMKSRVQRARQRLKSAIDACCRIEIDRRGGVVGFEAREGKGCGGCDPRGGGS